MFVQEIFEELEDPRKRRNRSRHPFLTIIFIGIIGAIAGITSWTSLEDFAEARKEVLEQYIDISAGIPSHDTFQRIFTLLDSDRFLICFERYTQILSDNIKGTLALDGKEKRGSKKNGHNPLHTVSVWSTANKLVVTERSTQGKGNELVLMRELLELLDLHGQIVTIDAMGCQKDIAETIVNKGGDYILQVKGNQKNLHEDIKDYFSHEQRLEHLTYWNEYDKGHGRIERRECFVSDDISWLSHQWEGLKNIVMVRSTVEKKSQRSEDVRFYITSLENDAKKVGRAIRAHWEVENKVHWVLDMSLNEDRCQIYKDNAPENMGILRKFALNFVNKHKPESLSVKRFQAKLAMSNYHLDALVKNI